MSFYDTVLFPKFKGEVLYKLNHRITHKYLSLLFWVERKKIVEFPRTAKFRTIHIIAGATVSAENAKSSEGGSGVSLTSIMGKDRLFLLTCIKL